MVAGFRDPSQRILLFGLQYCLHPSHPLPVSQASKNFIATEVIRFIVNTSHVLIISNHSCGTNLHPEQRVSGSLLPRSDVEKQAPRELKKACWWLSGPLLCLPIPEKKKRLCRVLSYEVTFSMARKTRKNRKMLSDFL